MKAMIGLSALFWLLLVTAGFVVTQADAHEVATRCGAYSCSTIMCKRNGDHCRRYDEERRGWSDRHRDGYEDSGYWHHRADRWRSNCDRDNPTCVVRGNRLDERYDE